jgi:hypothetical protein
VHETRDGSGACRTAAEIGEGFESFTSGIHLLTGRLRELNEQTGTVCCHLYIMLPTWRAAARDAAVAPSVGSDQVSDVVLIEAVAQALWTLRARSGAHRGLGECHSVAKPQVSGLRRVRVSGKYLHR